MIYAALMTAGILEFIFAVILLMRFFDHEAELEASYQDGFEYGLKIGKYIVTHAYWIETVDLSGDHYAECSNCRLLWWIDGESSQEAEMNYCPRCGAIMDEEVEE